MNAEIFDARACALGEGPLWHPQRKQLFWFDILGKRLLTQAAGKPEEWIFEEFVSAAGWIDFDTLLIASQTGLWQFDLVTGARDLVVEIEANEPMTRSNDGRADPWGGFWIGSMGINAEPEMGAIYRYFKGALRKVVSAVTISNSIAFSPDRRFAYYTDTRSRKIMRVSLNPDDGWPADDAEVLIDLTGEMLNPDGSVVDSEGCIWNAQWGAGRVARYAPNGEFIKAYDLPAAQATCPAFGGDDLRSVYVTTAADGLDGFDDGKTYLFTADVSGQPEHQIIL